MLRIENLQKNFGAVKALRDASLKLEKGEIRALLGANGSGKSTLVKVLSGLNRKDGGRIFLNETDIQISSPAVSKKYGIAMAYQDLSLIPELSLEENLVLGSEPGTSWGSLRKNQIRDYAEKMIEVLGIQAAPDTQVKEMDLSNQGLAEVAKAMYTKPQILILDEITASMHHDQVERLFTYLKREREKGMSILYVSHRFEEVYAFCETATILRGGISVKEVCLKETAPDRLVYYMTGEETKRESPDTPLCADEERKLLLQVENLTVGRQVKKVSLRLREGEIIGIAGLQGQGQSEFLRALYGVCAYQGGRILLAGEEMKIRSPKDAVKRGIGFISGDREKEEIFPVRNVAENLLIVEHAMKSLFSYHPASKCRKAALDIMDRLQIVASGTQAQADSLSGGNQQKLVVGRWLSRSPRLLLLDDPTKGVDVAARGEINRLFQEMTSSGTAIIYSSSDNDELLEIAQKIYVFYEGEIVKELTGQELNGESLARAMLGVTEEVPGDE